MFVHLDNGGGLEPLDDELPLGRVGDLVRAVIGQVLVLGEHQDVRMHINRIFMRRIK